jgi:hypothetical protein
VLGSQGDFLFVDGNHNNVEVLNKNDLTLLAVLKTDNNACFSFQLVGQKLFAGCSGNNLFVFEIDAALKSHTGPPVQTKRIKDLKCTSIIYCFYLIDYNTLLCGQRDGHL